MFKTKSLLVLLAGVMHWSWAMATPITVDGKPADWLINQDTWASSLVGVHQMIEDQTGSGAFFLEPGWGGQDYDAEALYAFQTDGYLYIALFTGHFPNTKNKSASNTFAAGDFAIDFGQDGKYELGINLTPPDDPFKGKTGGLYRNVTWNYGLWNSEGKYAPGNPDKTHPTSIAGVTSTKDDWLGTVDLSTSVNPVTGYGANKTDKHYFYEIGISLDLLRQAGWNDEAFNIHWTQNCANDSIMVDPPAASASPVPEPGTLALLPLGLVSLAALRRRKSA